MDFTMLQQMAQLCQFLAYLENHDSKDPGMDAFLNILVPEEGKKAVTIQPINDSEQAAFLADKAADLDPSTYDLILQYLNATGHLGQYHSNITSANLHLHTLVCLHVPNTVHISIRMDTPIAPLMHPTVVSNSMTGRSKLIELGS
jgi:hypothetical protein